MGEDRQSSPSKWLCASLLLVPAIFHIGRDVLGQLTTIQPLEEMQAHVDSRRDTGGGHDRAFIHPAHIAPHGDGGETLRRLSSELMCVVALCPSSRPTAPSRNAPVQTEVLSCVFGVTRRSHSSTAGRSNW